MELMRSGVVFHLALTTQWAQAQQAGHYPWSTRGLTLEEVGFVHCSRSMGQVACVYAHVYAHHGDDLVLLTVDVPTMIAAGRECRIELSDPTDPTSERFPHIYGGELPIQAVTHTSSFP